ncbi:MAG: hypothetical protein IKE17_02485, partial [Clostridia bacterium]|nr:hypothetical protein [Clostridia bacterium]
RPEQKRLPCRFAARKSPAISGKSEEDVLKGDLSPFKRAQARDKSVFTRLNSCRMSMVIQHGIGGSLISHSKL